MNKSARSPFQMIDCRVAVCDYHNTLFTTTEDIPKQWTIKAQKSFHYLMKEKQYSGSILIDTACDTSDGNREFHLHCIFLSAFSFQAEENDQNKDRMNQLISKNGMLQCLGALRSSLLMQSNILRMPFPCVLPSINLNDFEFEKEYSL